MSFSERLPLWWDRETDEQTGGPLRPDVRESAHRIWNLVCRKCDQILGDSSDAAEVLEGAVKASSRYLDKREVAVGSADPGGLVVLAVYRSLMRIAQKRHRIEFVGTVSELDQLLRTPNWRDENDRQIFLEELARELDPKTRGILRLRIAGYDWGEIARMMHVGAGNLRRNFWRDVGRAHLRLLRSGKGARARGW